MPTLKILNLSCINMALPGKKGPNTFIVIDVDGAVARTQTIKADANPKWTAELKFKLQNPRSCIVRFTIMEEHLLETKTLGSHTTTVGHLTRGKPTTEKMKWKLCKAEFHYQLLAVDFGHEPGASLDDAPKNPAPAAPMVSKWKCDGCGNVNAGEVGSCLRCGLAPALATVNRPC
eukprot:GGOE01046848.1.p2 GENE.GGOE01046848.1~~GGOE01046848.1.p2  ORF type:complete len:175 (+),score=43.53 GGOE01046848.1:112-636(+)